MDGIHFWNSVHGRKDSVRTELFPPIGGINPPMGGNIASMDGILIWPRIGLRPSVQEFRPWTDFFRPWTDMDGFLPVRTEFPRPRKVKLRLEVQEFRP